METRELDKSWSVERTLDCSRRVTPVVSIVRAPGPEPVLDATD